MKPQYEPKTREQFYGYLIEECGEVLHAAGKTLRWGEVSVNPELSPGEQESNLVWLKRELCDLRGAITSHRGLDQERVRLTPIAAKARPGEDENVAWNLAIHSGGRAARFRIYGRPDRRRP